MAATPPTLTVLTRSIHTGGGADEHQPRDVLRKLEGRLHGDHAAERYARENRARQARGLHHGDHIVREHLEAVVAGRCIRGP